MEMNNRAFVILVLLLFSAVNAVGQTCSDLKTIIDKTYGFKPSKLTAEQIDTKSSEMDKVWNMVGSKADDLLPCLRTEVGIRKTDTFFRFNASNLIFKYDQSTETKKLMVQTYSEADLADINLRYWLPYMADFGRTGLDVSRAGETWVRFPKPLYYLPQHGVRPVDKGVGALSLFGSMEESIATPALARLANDENTDFRSIVIWILVNQATDESDSAVLSLSQKLPLPLAGRLKQDVTSPQLIEPRIGKPKTSRESFTKAMKELLDGKPEAWSKLTDDVPDGEKDMVAVMTSADLPMIRQVRRYHAANATPHTPDWYTSFTQIINSIRSQLNKNKPGN